MNHANIQPSGFTRFGQTGFDKLSAEGQVEVTNALLRLRHLPGRHRLRRCTRMSSRPRPRGKGRCWPYVLSAWPLKIGLKYRRNLQGYRARSMSINSNHANRIHNIWYRFQKLWNIL